MFETIKEFLKKFLPPSGLRSLRRWRAMALLRVRVDKKSEPYKILVENWRNYRFDLFPVDRRMRVLKDRGVEGMATENIKFFINELVRRFAQNGVYAEAGSYQGSSLLSAALFNPSTRCIGIDNFSQFDKQGINERVLKENLAKFQDLKNIEFTNMDYKKALSLLALREPHCKIDIYYYDGDHALESQLGGLSAVLPFLSSRCFIIVDDVNLTSVSRANEIFIKNNPDFKSVLRIKTGGMASLDWWNGFEIISRGF